MGASGKPSTILVVDESVSSGEVLGKALRGSGCRVVGVRDGASALSQLDSLGPDLILVGSGMSGPALMELLARVRRGGRAAPVIMVAPGADVSAALNTLRSTVSPRAAGLSGQARALEVFHEGPAPDPRSRQAFTDRGEAEFSGLIGSSYAMQRVKNIIREVADSELTVLIVGETGAGKGVAAKAIHDLSGRADMPFIKVNCAALPETLLESELFGHEKGAFTGAYSSKPGRFEFASGGTIFLDEISEMSPVLQAKLLQVLEDRRFMRVGGRSEIEVDVRIIAATNKNMAEAIRTGQFRSDLYYRLNEVSLRMPSLRERREDIPELVRYLGERFAAQYRREYREPSPELMAQLVRYDWPGNVRELANVVKRIVVSGGQSLVLLGELEHAEACPVPEVAAEAPKTLREVAREAALAAERELISLTLQRTRWNRAQTARLLGVSYKTLLNKMKECGIG